MILQLFDYFLAIGSIEPLAVLAAGNRGMPCKRYIAVSDCIIIMFVVMDIVSDRRTGLMQVAR